MSRSTSKRQIKKQKEIYVKKLDCAPIAIENSIVEESVDFSARIEESVGFSDRIEESVDCSRIKKTLTEKLGQWYLKRKLSTDAFEELLLILNEENIDVPKSHVKNDFPVLNLVQLAQVEKTIDAQNREIYVKHFKTSLRGPLTKTITTILHNDLIMEVNVEGIHNKGRLKNFEKFYSVFIESIDDTDPEKAIKQALATVKKRNHHNTSILKNKKNNEK